MTELLNAITALPAIVELSPTEFVYCAAAVTLAGIVRGFSGFALSALVMASVAVIVPPVALIPVCLILEGTASLLMFRGGTRDADWQIVLGLAIGSTIGVPLGLRVTMQLPPETSKLVALLLILVLAALQLMRRSPAFLGTRTGLYAAGVIAGIATGLASIGGMVVALYVLARDAPPTRMRASLVMFLVIGMFTSTVWLVISGLFDRLAVQRGLAFAPFVIVGVLFGTTLFRPSLQGIYRRFCLLLLIGLASAGLLGLIFGS